MRWIFFLLYGEVEENLGLTANAISVYSSAVEKVNP